MKTETLRTVCIANNVVSIDQEAFHKSGQINFDLFSKEIYSKLNLSYPKFFKMDNLSKLCFLTVELLLQDQKRTNNWNGSKVAIVIGNKNSSLDQDQRHFDSIKNRENYFPSPSIFVYTLPNIMLGEICIRHKINGENTCFLLEKKDKNFLTQYANNLLETEDYDCCISGWIDYLKDDYESEVSLIKKIELTH